VIDHTNRRLLDVLENRDKTTVTAYLRGGVKTGLFGQLEEVTTDRWDAYVEAVRAVFGERVQVVIDRFHVMKNFQDQLVEARRALQRHLSEPDRQQLKGSRWLWVTNPENLAAEKQEQLEGLKRAFPSLGQLAEQREALRTIFEDRQLTTAAAGRQRLQTWMAQARKLGLSALDRFCQTLSNWLDKVANYFCHRSSNGRTEGFNRGLRAILWRACGMFNFKNFRQRALDAFGRPQG
jgi:transposase